MSKNLKIELGKKRDKEDSSKGIELSKNLPIIGEDD